MTWYTVVVDFYRRLWFRLAVSGGLIGLLVWRVDIWEALETLAEGRYVYVAAALPIYSLSKLVDAYRWRLMLAKLGSAPVLGLFGVYLVSNMANNLLPLRVGDAIRVQVPARRWGLPRAGLTATVFVTESLVDGVAFVILLLVALAFLDVPGLPLGLVWALIGAVSVGLVLAVAASRLELRPGWEDRGWAVALPAALRRLLARPLPEFLAGLAVLRDVPLAARTMTATFVAWLLETAVFWLFGLTFGLDLGLADYLVIMVTANMIVAMPVAPSNIGPYEVATAEVVALLGVESSLAGGFAIGSHLLNILWVGASGLVAVWLMRLSFEDVFFVTLRQAQGERKEKEPAP
ncbi:MAG: flippase-like domain-containing protein [Dehalococcoidia bacterium]|nr:MAG: flippase-like domain-containing protein [Dehalococcoidia bacterium]